MRIFNSTKTAELLYNDCEHGWVKTDYIIDGDKQEEILIYTPFTKEELEIKSLMEEEHGCRDWLRDHDYIGIKIATGRATVQEYLNEINIMNEKSRRINEINDQLEILKENLFKLYGQEAVDRFF